MDDPKGVVTLVSHCFGCGGLDAGLQRVFGPRLRTIAACEIEGYAVASSLKKVEQGKFGPEFPFWPDLKSFPFGAFRGLVDIYTAGFPCQPFSCAGAGKADDDPRHLWPWIRRGIERMAPASVFLENVPAIISKRLKGNGWSDPAGTPILLHVLRELERLGYRVEAGIYSAEEVGAPHLRKRVFIYGELANGDTARLQSPRCARSEDAGRPRAAVDGSSGKLDHTNGSRSPRRERGGGGEARQPDAGFGGSEVEHADGERQSQCGRNESSERGRVGNASQELGDSESYDEFWDRFSRESRGVQIGGPGSAVFPWPMGQGYAQHAWEPPRLIGSMDIDPNGIPAGLDRVDRIRMLGNAVVPQVAELAFRSLKEKFRK